MSDRFNVPQSTAAIMLGITPQSVAGLVRKRKLHSRKHRSGRRLLVLSEVIEYAKRPRRSTLTRLRSALSQPSETSPTSRPSEGADLGRAASSIQKENA